MRKRRRIATISGLTALVLYFSFTNAFAETEKEAVDKGVEVAKEALRKGNEYYKQGNYDGAIAEFTKAIKIDPKIAEAYANRGLAYAEKGNSAEAISDFNKAREINPNLRIKVEYRKK